MNSKKNLVTLVSSFIAVFLMIACSEKPVEESLIDSIVETKYGLVEGVANESNTVVAFKGIPYAAPPVGELRWKEPQEPDSWEGVYDATEFCYSCMQNRNYSYLPWTEEFMVQNDISEDCLFLNIWTPANSAEAKLPVLVFIHGGGFTEGSGGIDVYDGEELAKKGIVVITINYRLGVFGFLAHPELTAESPNNASGNYAILDQIAALKWVKNNIAAFGGDPDLVTIAGQSAGAMSVRSLIISPLAKGYFQRAITESGASIGGIGGSTPLEVGEERGVEFATAKGASSIADLRAMSAEEIMAAVPDQNFRFGTVTDGYCLTASQQDIFEAALQNDTPFMNGLNAGETGYRGTQDETFMELYPSSTEEEEAAAARQLAGEEQSRLNYYLWMEFRDKNSQTDGYMYFFNRGIPWPEHPEYGAFHTGEIPYVFNNLKMLDRPFTEVDTMVADVMSSYWVNFVKTGNPNGEGLPQWDAYSGNKQCMRLGEEMGMIPIAASDERFDFLNNQVSGGR